MPEPIEILLVEDSPEDVELTLHALKVHHIGNRVRVARDGAEALEFRFGSGGFAEQPAGAQPRLVLLDLKLPKVDGMQVLEHIRSDPRTRALPVVVLTSSRQDPDIAACYRLGVNSYIVKPVEFEAFMETVRQLGLYWLLVNEAPRGQRPAEDGP